MLNVNYKKYLVSVLSIGFIICLVLMSSFLNIQESIAAIDNTSDKYQEIVEEGALRSIRYSVDDIQGVKYPFFRQTVSLDFPG